ncbi:MAG: hypothetical protein WD114_01060 [Phycisphaerales bacterium]
MAAVLADLDESKIPGGTGSCLGCGQPMAPEAIICLACGFNRETGKQFNTRVSRDPNKPMKGAAALGVGAKVGGFALAPFLPIIGACVAGVVGAGLWAAIAYFTNYEIGFAASIVGAMCGMGALVGTSGEGNFWSGMVAVLTALAAIVIGKMLVFNIYSAQFDELRKELAANIAQQEYTLADMTGEDVLAARAYDLIDDMLHRGEEVEWPGEDMDLDYALYPEDYPASVIQEIESEWEALSEDEQLAARKAELEVFEADMRETQRLLETGPTTSDTAQTVIESLDYFDALWGFLALMAAWGVGAGMVDN